MRCMARMVVASCECHGASLDFSNARGIDLSLGAGLCLALCLPRNNHAAEPAFCPAGITERNGGRDFARSNFFGEGCGAVAKKTVTVGYAIEPVRIYRLIVDWVTSVFGHWGFPRFKASCTAIAALLTANRDYLASGLRLGRWYRIM